MTKVPRASVDFSAFETASRPMVSPGRAKWLDHTLHAALIIKAIDGGFEMIGGAALFFTTPATLHRILVLLTQHELSEDPQGLIASTLIRMTQRFSSAKTFAVVYLLSHGLAKLCLAAGILRHRLWVYPLMVGWLLVFVTYQLYRYSWSHSLVLLLLTLCDLGVAVLIWREYRAAHGVPSA